VRWLGGLHVPGLTGLMEAIVASTGSVAMIAILRGGTLLALLGLRRIRHLFVFVGSLLAVRLVIWLATVDRPRPFGIDLRGSWEGWAMPSPPVAILAATLVGVLYTLVPVGRWRQLGKWVAAGHIGPRNPPPDQDRGEGAATRRPPKACTRATGRRGEHA
jgi:Na+-transporting NADH:ubiquinone oxidoreductase subunit NqrB